MTNNKNLVPFSINISRETRTQLKIAAAKQEITMGILMRKIIEDYLAQDSDK